jgi:hypothetical protein
MHLPNLSHLHLKKSVRSPYEEEEVYTGVHQRSAGRPWGQHVQLLFQLPGALVKDAGVSYFFFRALRETLNTSKPNFYEARPDLARLVPIPLHTASEMRYFLREADYPAEFATFRDMWTRYFEAQTTIMEVLMVRWEKNCREVPIRPTDVYAPPYLYVNPVLNQRTDWDLLLPFNRAIEVVAMLPRFALHRGAFTLDFKETSGRAQLANSVKRFQEGPLDVPSSRTGPGGKPEILQGKEEGELQKLKATTFALMRELNIETRRGIYHEFFNMLARDMANNDRKFYDNTAPERWTEATPEMAKQRHAGSARLTLDMINTWERDMVNARTFMAWGFESPPWGPADIARIGLPADVTNGREWDDWAKYRALMASMEQVHLTPTLPVQPLPIMPVQPLLPEPPQRTEPPEPPESYSDS